MALCSYVFENLLLSLTQLIYWFPFLVPLVNPVKSQLSAWTLSSSLQSPLETSNLLPPRKLTPLTPAFSKAVLTEVVTVEDCDSKGVAKAGILLSWIDVAAGIVARRHSGVAAVTASLGIV